MLLPAVARVFGVVLGVVMLVELLGVWGRHARRREVRRWLEERRATPGIR
jgi:hypothetical protein